MGRGDERDGIGWRGQDGRMQGRRQSCGAEVRMNRGRWLGRGRYSRSRYFGQHLMTCLSDQNVVFDTDTAGAPELVDHGHHQKLGLDRICQRSIQQLQTTHRILLRILDGLYLFDIFQFCSRSGGKVGCDKYDTGYK